MIWHHLKSDKPAPVSETKVVIPQSAQKQKPNPVPVQPLKPEEKPPKTPDVDILGSISKGNLQEIKDYFEKGNKCDDKKYLTLAIHEAKPEVVSLLIQFGCDVTSPNLLGQAFFQGDVEIVKILVDAGAPLNLEAGAGIDQAVERMDAAMVQYLASVGANLNVRNKNGQTPVLSLAYKFPREKEWPEGLEMLRVLAQAGCDLNLGDGESPLHRAVRIENVTLAQTLVDLGADLSVRDSWHRTPRGMAEDFKNKAIARILSEGEYKNAISGASRKQYTNRWANGVVAKIESLKASVARLNLQKSRESNLAAEKEKIQEINKEIEELTETLRVWRSFHDRGGLYKEVAEEFEGNDLDLEALPARVAMKNIEETRRVQKENNYLSKEWNLAYQELSDIYNQKRLINELKSYQRVHDQKLEQARKEKIQAQIEAIIQQRRQRAAELARIVRLFG